MGRNDVLSGSWKLYLQDYGTMLYNNIQNINVL